ncbi:MAG: hypothetical protein PHF42_13160, partial [Pseudomonas sp.]|nr:hypothetical protein [Pseudomonas sp.]
MLLRTSIQSARRFSGISSTTTTGRAEGVATGLVGGGGGGAGHGAGGSCIGISLIGSITGSVGRICRTFWGGCRGSGLDRIGSFAQQAHRLAEDALVFGCGQLF